MTHPRWPIALWSLHLLVPASLLALAAARVIYRAGMGTGFLAVAALAALWLLAGLGVLLRPRGRTWLRTRRRELALCAGTALGAAAVADGVLTTTGIVPTIEVLSTRFALRYRSAAFSLGRLEPNQSLVLPDRPPIHINARGFRGPDFAVRKADGTRRIVVLGGSQVFDPNGDNWPVEVGRRLSRADRPVEAINAGVPSHRTADSVGKCMTELWMYDPDVLVLCQAWNDIKYFTRLTPETPYRDLHRPTPGDWRLEPEGLDRMLCVSSLYRLARMRIAHLTAGEEGERRRPTIGEPTTWSARQYRLDVELFCDLAANIGAEAVLCTQPRLPAPGSGAEDRARTGYDYVGLSHATLIEAYAGCDTILESVARRKRARFLDLNRAMSGRPELFEDHVHFNRRGSEEAARIVAAHLEGWAHEPVPAPQSNGR